MYRCYRNCVMLMRLENHESRDTAHTPRDRAVKTVSAKARQIVRQVYTAVFASEEGQHLADSREISEHRLSQRNEEKSNFQKANDTTLLQGTSFVPLPPITPRPNSTTNRNNSYPVNSATGETSTGDDKPIVKKGILKQPSTKRNGTPTPTFDNTVQIIRSDQRITPLPPIKSGSQDRRLVPSQDPTPQMDVDDELEESDTQSSSPRAITPCRSNTTERIKRKTYEKVPIDDCIRKFHMPTIIKNGHIFISYQWDNKPLVFQISRRLKEAGYLIWIDQDKMGSDVCDGMADAVENADAVIICMSQRYKDSPNCQAEAKYSHQLDKKLIALTMQKKFKPAGWLGEIVFDKTITMLNFSDPDALENSMVKLISELGDSGKKDEEEEEDEEEDNNKTEKSPPIEYLPAPIEIVHEMPSGTLLRGITVLFDEVFIVREETPNVEVYNPNTFTLLRRLDVDDLSTPRDIDASAKYSCLYIVNFALCCMHRVELLGKVTRWPLRDRPRGISVTRDGFNIVVAFAETRTLRQYTTHGVLAREICLPDNMQRPLHGIQVTSGGFVVCHGIDSQTDPLHRVCLVGVDGSINLSYGAMPGSKKGQVHIPERMDVDRSGFIFVSELQNQRVLMLNPDLTYSRVLIEPRVGREAWDSRRLCLDEERGRLYLIEWEIVDGVYVNSELCVFQIIIK